MVDEGSVRGRQLAADELQSRKGRQRPHHKQRSCSFFRVRTMTGRTLAKSEFSILRWRHSPSL